MNVLHQILSTLVIRRRLVHPQIRLRLSLVLFIAVRPLFLQEAAPLASEFVIRLP